MDFKLTNPEKALSPILVTELGILIEVKLEHPEKVLLLISVIELGIEMDVKLSQFLNAFSLNSVTE